MTRKESYDSNKKRVVVGRNRRWRHLRDREKRKLSQRGTRYLIIIDFAIKAAFSVSKEDDTVIISTTNWFYDLLSMLNGCHISLISTNFSSHFFLLCLIDVSHPQKMRGRRRSQTASACTRHFNKVQNKYKQSEEQFA